MDTVLLCHVLAVFLGLLDVTRGGSQIVFESTPTIIEPLVSANLTLRCSLRDGPTSTTNGGLVGRRGVGNNGPDITFITSVAITRGGVDVAAVSQQFPARVFGNSSEIEVTGQIQRNAGERGFLEIVYKYPSTQQSGNYKCEVSGLDQDDHSHVITSSLDVAKNEVSYTDLISEIHQIKTDRDRMQGNIDIQTKTISDQGKLIDGLLKMVKEENATIAVMQQQISNNAIKDPIVLFSVGLLHNLSLSESDVVKFDDIFANVGNGYNISSGEFVSPVTGYYLFLINVRNQHSKWLRVRLCHNSCAFSHIYIGSDDNDGQESASNSVVAFVRKGDKLWLTSWRDSYLEGYPHPYNTFSGVLISPA